MTHVVMADRDPEENQALRGSVTCPMTAVNPQAAQQYLRTKVLTATPEQLQLMLYDGALRFGEQAKVALRQKDYEESYNLITRVQKIVNELTFTLKHEVAPELCAKLAALYNYAYRQLFEASIRHDPAALESALSILRYQRETWVMLMEKLGKQKAAASAARIDMPEPDPGMERLSMTG
jgi:flagellar protein FliS